MPSEDDATRFESTESYYARYRPDYGDAAIDYLVDRFDLDDGSRVLDLGCGAGQIAVPLARRVGEVVGMDPNEAMLREAREAAREAGVENVEWVVGSDADLDRDLGRFRATTMGRSFHWMDQEWTLDHLYATTDPGGGVAILTDWEWLTRGTADWQVAAYDVVDRYLDDLPDRRPRDETDRADGGDPWDELIAAHGFDDVATTTVEFRREWDAESVVGYVLSLSFASPKAFGDDQPAFEADLRERLAELGGGPFRQDVELEILSGRK